MSKIENNGASVLRSRGKERVGSTVLAVSRQNAETAG